MERRRRASWVDVVMFGLLGFFVIATLGRALIGADTLVDVNLLTQYPPWQALRGQNSLTANICRSDTVDNLMPSISAIRSGLFQGHFPGWSDASVGGFPLAGSPNYGQFSPLALPYYLLPLWLAPAFVKLAEFAVAIVGMTLFLRRLRLSVASGILAGIVFASSGFMISWTNWPHTRVAAFIPLLFWATERLVQRQRAVDALPLAAVVAAMVLGGFPAVTGMALYCAALYFLVRIIMVHRSRWKTSVRAALLACLGLGLGATLSAFQLLPFAKQLSAINISYRAQTADTHSPLASLLTTMVPDAQGLCIGGVRYGPVNPIENVAFIGVAAIVLGLVAIMTRARPAPRLQRGAVGFLGVAVVVVVVLGWVGGPLLSVAQHFPVFSNNPISRIRSVLGFLVAVLAGFGFERLLNLVRDRDKDRDKDSHPPGSGSDDQSEDAPAAVGERARARARAAASQSTFGFFGFFRFRPLWSVAVLAGTTIFAFLVLRDAISQARLDRGLPHLKASLLIPAILLVICVIAVIAVFFARRAVRRAAIVVIALIVVGQSTSAVRASVPGSDPENFYPSTSTHQFLQRNLGPDRFASSEFRMFPATAPYYGLRTPTGHQFTTPAWKALLGAIDPHSARTVTFSLFTSEVVNAGTVGHIPLLDQMAVRYFVAADTDIAGTKIDPPRSSNTVALTSDQHASCAPASGPVRAVTVRFAGPMQVSAQSGATLHVTLHTPRGDLSGARYFTKSLKSPAAIPVAIPGEDLTRSDPVTADVWVSGAPGTFVLEGSRTALSCGEIVPIRDGLKLVSSASGAIVYQRLTSLSRIRWASRAVVQTDPAKRVASLRAGIGPDTVLLDTAGPAASGEPAKVRVTSADGDTLAADVDAAGAGYLVVADSLQQPGWSATVDGRPAALLPADNAMVAVAVPAGVHRVVLSYTVPGQRTGILLTGGALLVCLAICALWWRRRRRPLRGHPSSSGLVC